MTSTDYEAVRAHPWSLLFELEHVRRFVGRYPILAAAAAIVVVGGGSAGTAVALTQSGGFRAAAVCPKASAYVYEVPSYPAQSPTAAAWPPGGNDYWGWMPRRHALKVGDRLRVDGALWQITAIAALPGDCKFFATEGPAGGLLAGRLVLAPAG